MFSDDFVNPWTALAALAVKKKMTVKETTSVIEILMIYQVKKWFSQVSMEKCHLPKVMFHSCFLMLANLVEVELCSSS